MKPRGRKRKMESQEPGLFWMWNMSQRNLMKTSLEKMKFKRKKKPRLKSIVWLFLYQTNEASQL
jgi:hypothetical protein